MVHTKTKAYLNVFIALIAAGVILGYAYWRTSDLLAGPRITIDAPQNGAVLDESLLAIRGVAANVSSIQLNGRDIFINETGAIREEVLLAYGYNVFTLEAADRYGRKVTEILEVVYK